MNKKAQIILISQNLKLESLKKITDDINLNELTVIVSTQYLFDFERQQIENILKNVSYYTFADFLTDKEMEICDQEAYKIENNLLCDYYDTIKRLKNEKIIKKIEQTFIVSKKIIAADDLGIDEESWINAGYTRFYGEYYFAEEKPEKNKGIIQRASDIFRSIRYYMGKSIYSAQYNRIKYVFYGEMFKVAHRMDLQFKKDRKENFIYVMLLILNKLRIKIPCRKNVIHISSLHESLSWHFFDNENYHIGLIQDGYLPPNYSSLYLKFITPNEHYFAYDDLGKQLFIRQEIPVSLLPFRKKLYMPFLNIKSTIKNILVVTSGAGDWTAIKNRSDEDKMIEVFVILARRYPNINFIYRCHPLWIHPSHQGVNSINRVAEYFNRLGFPNLRISGNIPEETLENFHLSIPRQSMEEDLKQADLVFGEHSVAMLDAAFRQIPFASINVTGRRNFFCGITELGFPHFESVEGITEFIDKFGTKEIEDIYGRAVQKYNEMIDKE